jgi:tRNA dimethylallyltransferase
MEESLTITVTGPTACGKTAFAARLACELQGEVISVDSRQVYRGLDLGTGKDYEDYIVRGHKIPYHLVDVVDPGHEYSVYEFSRDFKLVLKHLQERKKIPILCGGTGLYLEAVLKGYNLVEVPRNDSLRNLLEKKTMEEMITRLQNLKVPHNLTDIKDMERLVRAIEIGEYYKEHPGINECRPLLNNMVFIIDISREKNRENITLRLQDRLRRGMIGEVEGLLKKGLPPSALMFYGLEYRYITRYLLGELSYDEMFRRLNTAIHQFAKRQMTWFRKMQREGIHMHPLDGELGMDEKVSKALEIIAGKKPAH